MGINFFVINCLYCLSLQQAQARETRPQPFKLQSLRYNRYTTDTPVSQYFHACPWCLISQILLLCLKGSRRWLQVKRTRSWPCRRAWRVTSVFLLTCTLTGILCFSIFFPIHKSDENHRLFRTLSEDEVTLCFCFSRFGMPCLFVCCAFRAAFVFEWHSFTFLQLVLWRLMVI